MSQNVLDLVELKLTAPFTSGQTTFTARVSKKYRRGQDSGGDPQYYDLTKQIATGLMTDFDVTFFAKGADYVETVRIASVVEDSDVGGRPEYTFTLGDDGGTALRGYGNDNDGEASAANVDTDNIVDTFPEGSVVKLAWNTGSNNKTVSDLANALSEINDESNLVAASFDVSNKAAQQRVVDQQDAYETTITAQQDAYETTITAQQDAHEAQVALDIESGNFAGLDIACTIDDTDTTLVNFSSGSWLDGATIRDFTGSLDVNPADSVTTYYEILTGTTALSSNTSAFTDGAYPIAVVVTDGAGEVTSIKNIGGAYSIPASAETVTTSSGSADEGKLVLLDANGLFDSSVIPPATTLPKGFNFGIPVVPFSSSVSVEYKKNLSTTPYTIPADTAAYILSIYTGSGSSSVSWDSKALAYGYASSGFGTGSPPNPILLHGNGSKTISASSNGNVVGLLEFDDSLLGDLIPTIETLSTSDYTVPTGKVLVMTNYVHSSSGSLQVSQDGGTTYNGLWEGVSSYQGKHVGNPIHFNAGDKIKMSAGAGVLIGYTLPDTYTF